MIAVSIIFMMLALYSLIIGEVVYAIILFMAAFILRDNA